MYELARQIVCSIIAVALGTTVTIVRGLLPLNPQWVERVAQLAAHFRAMASGRPLEIDGEEVEHADQPEQAEINQDLRNILSAYQQLWDFVQSLKAKGISLDDEFCERVEREWSVSTLLSYMRSVDKTIQDSAAEAQVSAARYLMPSEPSEGGTA